MSETWLIIGLFVLGVAILFPVVMLILDALVRVVPKKFELCPACGQRRLHLVRGFFSRGGGGSSYFLCYSCGSRYKQHGRGDFEIVSGEEWALWVDPGTLFMPRAAKGESCAEPVTPLVKRSTMHNLNPELRFPKPPFRIDPACENLWSQDNLVSSYLDQIRSWRLAVLAFIENSGGKQRPEGDGLSERAQQWLATFLASHWTPGMTNYSTQSPYNLSPFPASVLEAASNPTMESVFEVLRWRAGVVDCLSDVYDVIDEPSLDLFECVAIGEFLDPIGKEKLCCFCLTELTPNQLASDEHDCMLTSHVQAKWPPMPSIFARWATPARTEESKTGTDRLPPPAP